MNRRQKALLRDVVIVITLTASAVVAMINLKDWVNRSETMRAMERLGRHILEYRERNAILPSESYVTSIRQDLEVGALLDSLRYRALWIDYEAAPDEILAYAERKYHASLLAEGYVVLRLDGSVEWMGKKEFEELLSQQQDESEIESPSN